MPNISINHQDGRETLLKTITLLVFSFCPPQLPPAQWPFLWEGFQELCRHDLMAGGISLYLGKKFRP